MPDPGTTDFLTEAEDRLQEIILADSFFQGVTVLRNANGDLTAKIEEAVASLGLFLIMRVFSGKPPALGDSENWRVEFMIIENPLLARGAADYAGKTARFALQALIRVCADSGCADLLEASEIVTEGMVVWQVTGNVLVAVPAE